MSQITNTSFHENTMAIEPMDTMPMAGRSQQRSQTSPAVNRNEMPRAITVIRIVIILFSSLKYDGFVCGEGRSANKRVICQVICDERQSFVFILELLAISEALASSSYAPPLNIVVHIFDFHCCALLNRFVHRCGSVRISLQGSRE